MTWYEFMFHELNPHDTDWGAWYEDRREALVGASIRNPYFRYSFWASVAVIFLAAGFIKSHYDRKKEKQIMGDMIDKVSAHDAHSRRVAHEAIRQYNEHIEMCNRAIEASATGQSPASGGESQVDRVQKDLNKAQQEIDLLKRDKARLEAEVERRGAAIPDLSMRIDALSRSARGNGQGQEVPKTPTTSNSDLLRQINLLQQQLYAEREKNRHLKGGM